MSTTYHPFKIALTDGQKKKLQKAYVTKTPVNLKVKPDQIGRGVELLLTETQIARLKKRSAAGKGMVIKLSQTQIQSTSQCSLEKVCKRNHHHRHHEQDDHQEYQKVKGCKFNLHLFMELGRIIIV